MQTQDTQLSTEQQNAVMLAVKNLSEGLNFTLRGPAGTGKTTVIKAITDELKTIPSCRRVAIAAPTGKASLILQRKGLNARTIHKLCYEQISDTPLKFEKKKSISDVDVIIVDESSMVNFDIYNDLLSFNIPICFVGDSAQLEPIGRDPKILDNADFELTKVFRTAEESPVLGLATYLRENPRGSAQMYIMNWINKHDNSVITAMNGGAMRRNIDLMKSYDQVICGTNKTRLQLNDSMRVDPTVLVPTPGDKVICLKNDYQHGTINGEIFVVGQRGIMDGNEATEYEAQIQLICDDGSTIIVPFWMEFFYDRSLELRRKPRNAVWLDFGYAITCHKSQGSEWPNILVFDEAFGNPPNRWRYTAATRAQEKLSWVM